MLTDIQKLQSLIATLSFYADRLDKNEKGIDTGASDGELLKASRRYARETINLTSVMSNTLRVVEHDRQAI